MHRAIVESEAREDFNRARKAALFTRVFSLFSRDPQRLLSLQEVRDAIKPYGETYRGMQQIAIDSIVGSEGRYADFNRRFLPRHEYLRNRWQRIDVAHLSDVILPPIKLYEVGGAYFVRDGNHRVSVAKAQGAIAIDAEVISLNTDISLAPDMTPENLKMAVIEHERRAFMQRFEIARILGNDCILLVTATGRYDEIAQHISVHKYYLDRYQKCESAIDRVIRSWYHNVYRPIVSVVESEGVMARFPKRTTTDMYLWIVKHWDELKQRYGSDFPAREAVKDYTSRFGIPWWRRLRAWLGDKRAQRALDTETAPHHATEPPATNDPDRDPPARS